MATYFVSKTGSAANPGTELAPKLTINQGVALLSPGDNLYIKAGTYVEWLNNNIPGGTSWSAPVSIARYGSDAVAIIPPTGSNFVVFLEGSAKRYISIDGLILDAINANSNCVKLSRPVVGTNTAHHIRIQNCELRNAATAQALLTTYGSDYNEFLNLSMHNCGKVIDSDGLYGYGMYLKGSYNIVQGCEIYDMGSSGLQIYSTTGGSEPPVGNIIRSCRIHDTCVNSRAQNRGAGLSLTSGSSHEAYNNLIWANVVGIFIDYSSNHKVYHNTVALNSDLGIFVGSASVGTTVQNNIMWRNAGGTIVDYGASTLKTPNFTSDPHFVNS